MKPIRWMAVLCLAVATSGCWPVERIVWSPDGNRAAIFAEDHVYLCDPNGDLADGGALPAPRAFVWFADSQRVAFSVETPVREWKEVEPLLSERDMAWLTESAEALRINILENFRDDLSNLKSFRDLTRQQEQLMKMYLRDRHPEGLAAKLGTHWEEFVGADWKVSTLSIGKVTDKGIRIERTVARSIDQIIWCRINGQSRTLAYTLCRPGECATAGHGSPDILSLCVVACDGNSPSREVGQNTNWTFDWTADGTILVFAAGHGRAGDKLNLGTISSRQVCDADGSLLKEFKNSEDLAAICFSVTRIVCLPDGQIVFSGLDVCLPATSGDMPTRVSLYALDPAKRSTIARLLTRQAQMTAPDQMHLFTLSGDQTRLGVPGQGGEVSIINLATSAVEPLVSASQLPRDPHLSVIPSWRAGKELCFLVPPGSPYGSPNRAEIVLYSSSDQFRCISKKWPDSIIQSLSENCNR